MSNTIIASTSGGTLIIVALLYFLPTLIAVLRKVSSQGSVFVVNLFLGWTLIGWVVALAMAARSVPTTSPVPGNEVLRRDSDA